MAGQSTFFGRNEFEPLEDEGITLGGHRYEDTHLVVARTAALITTYNNPYNNNNPNNNK